MHDILVIGVYLLCVVLLYGAVYQALRSLEEIAAHRPEKMIPQPKEAEHDQHTL